MLPAAALMTLNRYTLAAVAALSIAAVTPSPAQALGENEQNFLKGVAAAVIVNEIIKQTRRNRAPAPEPMYYVQPQPQPQHQQPRFHQPAASIHSTAAARAFRTYSGAERRLIQKRLAASGHYTGRVDGAFGPATYRAIVAYARDEGAIRNLETTGGAFTLYDGLIF